MKLYIAYNFKESAFGGANQFLKALKKYCKGQGVYSDSIRNADVVLFNSMIPYSKAFLIKYVYPRKLYVHRVDGPCKLYNDMSDKRDDMVYALNNRVADATIFQSKYVMEESVRLGCPRQRFETVIYNGCDKNIFFRKKEEIDSQLRNRRIKIIATSFSDNWNKGFKTYQWMDQHIDFDRYEMTFVGRAPCEFENIRILPPMKSQDLAECLRQQDIYITASINDPCSNSLIEAMSCGLPALALNSGGHPEIIGSGGILFESEDQIPERLEEIVQNYDLYSSRAEGEGIEAVGLKYIEFIQMVANEESKGLIRKKRINIHDAVKVFLYEKVGRIWIP